ncbi:MAG: alpha/beta fold hydrolase [Deltaproteobacteria bacterium]|nr:alpha/beta fold hydrolase [Deltaproteobacteria bacterium]
MLQEQRPSIEEIAAQARAAVDRALQRHIPGLGSLDELTGELGTTPKDVIYNQGTLKLYRYRPLCDEIYRVPIVLVMSLVSRSYILDLTKGQSLVEFLLQHGFDVYLIDWGVPRAEHATLRLEDYVLDFIPACVRVIQDDSGEPDVSMVGYCMGGQLAVMYTALHADGPVKNLVCFTTPINAEGMSLYRTWTDPAHFDLDRVLTTLGNLPPELLEVSFDMLRPFQKAAGRLKLLDNVQDDAFVKAHLRFERWAADQIPFAGATARQFITDFIRENKLVRNAFTLAGRTVDLGQIRVPFLHVAAEHDHIVPAAASRDLLGLIGGQDKSEIILKGGHVSLVAGTNAAHRLWPRLDRWLAERSV